MAFEPGVASMRQAGIPVTVGSYSTGSAGIRISLETMARKMREGMIDAAVQGWAADVLKKAGLDGRSRSTSALDAQGAALLDALREQVIYAPDPYGTEQINSAAATLCLRPNLCLNRGDCDDLVVTLGAAALSLGIPVQIVNQKYGGGQQEHVLLVMYDGADWQYADPSTNLPFGSALKAKEETWVDPMGPVGNLPESSPQIVSLGRPNDGFGATTTAAPIPTASTPYNILSGLGPIQVGLRYRISMIVSGSLVNEDGSVNPDTQQHLTNELQLNWLVESIGPDGNVTGSQQSWLFQGVAKVGQPTMLSPDADATIVSVAQQSAASSAGSAGHSTTPAAPPKAPAPKTFLDLKTALIVVGVGGAIGGVWWGMHHRAQRGRR